MNNKAKPLSNLQLELLKVFSFDLEEQQLLDIRELLSSYFAGKATQEMDVLFAQNGWGEEKVEEWSKQPLRTKYQ